MTVHQLYDGGPANSTIARTQWPAYPFSPTDPKFAEFDAGVHNGNPMTTIRRVLDFQNDYMLRNYFTNNVVAQADVLNLIVLPPKTLLLGLYVEVENATNNLGSILAAPVANAPTTATTGGTLGAGTYYYKVTALGVQGETNGSNEVSITTTGSTSSNTITWAAVTGATGYKVYRGTQAGQESAYYTVGAVTTYTDTNAAVTGNGVPPTVSTATGTQPALTMTFGSYSGKTFGSAAVDCTVLSANFAPPNSPWVNGTAGGAASLATANYIGTQPDCVQATLTAMGSPNLQGFGGLRIEIVAPVLQLQGYAAQNFHY